MARGGRGGRGGGGGPREPLPRSVQVSKKISWLLRHGAEQEGLRLGEGGFLNVQDVLNNRKIRSMKVTFDELRQAVEDNDKQRFTMIPTSSLSKGESADPDANEQPALPSDNPGDFLIRANQGHSIKVESEGLLKPITLESLPETVVHGTTHAAWTLIVESGGLKTMGRNHVHFASGLPAGFKSVVDADKDTVSAAVISGMRKTSAVLIYLDIKKAIDAGLEFGLSDNGVILTSGDEEGLVLLEFFKRVEDRTGHGVLVQDGNIVKAAPSSWTPNVKKKG